MHVFRSSLQWNEEMGEGRTQIEPNRTKPNQERAACIQWYYCDCSCVWHCAMLCCAWIYGWKCVKLSFSCVFLQPKKMLSVHNHSTASSVCFPSPASNECFCSRCLINIWEEIDKDLWRRETFWTFPSCFLLVHTFCMLCVCVCERVFFLLLFALISTACDLRIDVSLSSFPLLLFFCFFSFSPFLLSLLFSCFLFACILPIILCLTSYFCHNWAHHGAFLLLRWIQCFRLKRAKKKKIKTKRRCWTILVERSTRWNMGKCVDVMGSK